MCGTLPSASVRCQWMCAHVSGAGGTGASLPLVVGRRKGPSGSFLRLLLRFPSSFFFPHAMFGQYLVDGGWGNLYLVPFEEDLGDLVDAQVLRPADLEDELLHFGCDLPRSFGSRLAISQAEHPFFFEACSVGVELSL